MRYILEAGERKVHCVLLCSLSAKPGKSHESALSTPCAGCVRSKQGDDALEILLERT